MIVKAMTKVQNNKEFLPELEEIASVFCRTLKVLIRYGTVNANKICYFRGYVNQSEREVDNLHEIPLAQLVSRN